MNQFKPAVVPWPGNPWMRIAGGMVCLPWTTFACTMGAFLCLLDDAMAVVGGEVWPDDGDSGEKQEGPGEQERSDQDLGGDELKYVSYSILFTKRDYEVVLAERREELLNYSTDGASFAALKVAEFFGRMAAKQVRRPPLWVELDYRSEADSADLYDWQLGQEDRRYLKFIYRVEVRLAMSAMEYEMRKTRALESIAQAL